MATLKEILAGLSNEQLDALLQEFQTAQANGGNFVGMESPAGGVDATGNINPAGRGVLPQGSGLGPRIGMGLLSGAQAAGESVVRDVRSMAGFKAPEKTLAQQLEELKAKEQIKSEVKGSVAKEGFNLRDDTEVPEGYEIAGYDQKGNPMIRKIDIKKASLSPTLEKVKQQRTEDLITTVEQNKVKRDMISQAEIAAKNIDTGVYGKIRRGILKGLGSNDPLLGEWQKIKMVLTDAQLLNTAKTKGAISDKEMELFSRAAANDDITSLPAMIPVFNKLKRIMEADEKSKKDTFKKLYDEDPVDFLGEEEIKDTTQSEDPLNLR